jgi:tetratricopeptide (TPR) repeat protein
MLMTDSNATDAFKVRPRALPPSLFGVVVAAVIGLLLLGAEPGLSVLKNANAKDCYYNLLIQGFRAGQLNIKKEVPPGLAQLANPYDPAANAAYIADEGDMTYYKGKLYLYFGVTPALVLYWPYVAVTGHYLQDAWAGFIFCSIGFLVGAGLLYANWRRYFPQIKMWIALAGIFIFGLMISAQEAEWLDCRIYEVALSGGFAFSMLALAAIWAALHQPRRRHLWLLLASLAYGLAVGSRPSLLPGAAILLIPVLVTCRSGWRAGQGFRVASLLLAAAGPITLIGLGLMLYNFRRFGNPFEFGYRYEISGFQQNSAPQFSLHYLWFNLRYYFLQPMLWNRNMPFLNSVPQWPSPTRHFWQGQYYGGIMFLDPLAWIVLAVPLAWKNISTKEKSAFPWFLGALFLLFVTCALTLSLFIYATSRYELDFLPALILAALIGVFLLESNSLASSLWRRIGRWGWRALAAWMVITSLLGGLDANASANYFAGNVLVNRGLLDEAMERFRRTLAIEPRFAGAYDGLGNVLVKKARNADAIIQYQRALEIKPDLIGTHFNLGHCYYEMGRIPDAIAQDQVVLKLDPNFAKARNDLASCLLREGQIAEALAQFEKAVEIAPDFADAHNNLGYCLLQKGRVPEAVVQFKEAVELDPQSANFRCGLGNALLKAGRVDEAIAQYQKAVAFAPSLAGPYYDLASGLLQSGRLDDAIGQYQKAVELKPDSATYHWGLARALAQKGLSDEAAIQYKKAIDLQPALIKKLQSQTNSSTPAPFSKPLNEKP